jgi:hypothetical protein
MNNSLAGGTMQWDSDAKVVKQATERLASKEATDQVRDDQKAQFHELRFV